MRWTCCTEHDPACGLSGEDGRIPITMKDLYLTDVSRCIGLDTTVCRTIEETVMTKPRSRSSPRFFVLSLILCSSIAVAEPLASGEPVTEPGDVAELKIYKQRVKVTAGVVCRIYERRPIFCTVDAKPPVMAALKPELILRYSGLRIGDKAFELETTPDHNIKFRADKVNLTGQQQVDVEVIYVK